MKIYYDYQILVLQKYGGISRYVYEVLTRLQRMKGVEADIHGIHSVSYYFRERLPMHPEMTGRKWTFYNKLNQYCTKAQLLGGGVDVFHPTYYDPYFLGGKYRSLVVTVHDMTHEIYHERFPEHLDAIDIQRKRQLIYAADRVIAVSKNTKRDILRYYPDVPEDKIKVIYHGTGIGGEMGASPGEDASSRVYPYRYVLYVGQRVTYKNFTLFLRAMRRVMARDKDVHLLCLGGGAFSAKERELIGDLSPRVTQMDIRDELLAQAYRDAECFVFPSLYEGFGIPTLEAFGYGCPVVMSDSSSLPEVGGDAALYFPPEDEEQMAGQILRVLDDTELRETLRRRGYAQGQKFSWDRAAELTMECYQSLV